MVVWNNVEEVTSDIAASDLMFVFKKVIVTLYKMLLAETLTACMKYEATANSYIIKACSGYVHLQNTNFIVWLSFANNY